MADQLYHHDAHLDRFEANVAARRTTKKGVLELSLDRTAFYPEGGGQPCDLGWLGDARVTAVRKDETGEVWHAVESDPGDGPLEGLIDWARRFDYMQQHTGQHILSACFLRIAGFETVSVHLGSEFTTIEFAASECREETEREIEDLANRVIDESRPVRSFWCDESEVEGLDLRREPKVGGRIRIVEIEGLDRVACGGVHARHTGDVSLIRNMRRERIRGRLRYAFSIGARAHEHHRAVRDIAQSLMDILSVPEDRIVERVIALDRRLHERERELDAAERELEAERAAQLFREAGKVPDAGLRLVSAFEEDADPARLRRRAEALSEYDGVVFVLGTSESAGVVWIAGHGNGVHIDQRRLREEAFPIIEARGGGKPPIFQGKSASTERWDAFVGAVCRCAALNG